MSIYKAKNSRFYLYDFRIGSRRVHGSTRETGRREAEQVERRIKAEAQADLLREKIHIAELNGERPMSLDIAAGRWWQEVGQYLAAPKTVEHNLERLIAWFGPDRLLTEITDSDVARWMAERRADKAWKREKAKPVSPATVNRTTVDVLRKIFGRAKRAWKMTLSNEPNWPVHRLKEPTRIREASEAEEAALTSFLCGGYHNLWRFALASGLRFSECFITWGQVDEAEGVIHVIQKGNRPHSIPISREIAAILSACRDQHKEAVFTRDDKGQRLPITPSGMKSAWRRAVKKSGVRNLKFHDMRHTCMTRLVRMTGNLKLAQQLAGHADISTTATYYAHVTMEDLRRGMDQAAPTPELVPKKKKKA